jgi:hypothetical protein
MTPTEIIATTTTLLEAGMHANDLRKGIMALFDKHSNEPRRLEAIQVRMLFNETMQNIELLNRIKLEPGNELPVNHAAYVPVVLQLSTQVHEAVLVYGDAHPEHETLWQKLGFGEETLQLLDETLDHAPPGPRAKALTLHQALLYTTNKIGALRSLCGSDIPGSEVMRQVRYGVRLRNILIHEAHIAGALYGSSAMEKLQHGALTLQIERAIKIMS